MDRRNRDRLNPIEPPPTPWTFPDPRGADTDVVALGGDLEPGTILAAYRHGIFPMHLSANGDRDPELAWWSPDPRGILPLTALKVSRSLRRSCQKFEIRVDTAFDEVIEACGDTARDHGHWINDEIKAAYRELHRLGWVHSVESWSRDSGELAGGLYGVAIGHLFAGESMFHRATDASKVALVGLVRLLLEDQRADETDSVLLDVQWRTDHLASLGVIEVPRAEYLGRVSNAIHKGPLSAFSANIRNRP